MAYYSDEEIDALRAHADIVDVVGHYLQLQKSGKVYKAVCPFHNDHDPSMTVNPELQIYKCFACGAGGNVFRFVKEYENISFPEAVGRVASLTGFQLSVTPDFTRHEEKKTSPLTEAMNDAVNWSMYQMDLETGAKARAYCDARGLTPDVRKRFNIGFMPYDDRALGTFLKAKGYSEKDLSDANLVRVSDTGMHDVFAGRLSFPIHDMDGKPIGFSARDMEGTSPSKYINTTETPLFKKGDIVYNAHRAKMKARHDGKIYVAEGVTDVISFDRAGVENCVCTLGTSCTENQLRLIRSMALQIVFCYDGDEAGQNATARAIRMCEKIGASARAVVNTTGKDPDEIIRELGAEAFRNMLKNEVSALEFLIQFEASRTNMQSWDDKRNYVSRMMDRIALEENPLDREHYTKLVSDAAGMELKAPVYQKPAVIVPQRPDRPKESRTVNGKAAAEQLILKGMLENPAASRIFEEELGFLPEKKMQTLAMMIVDAVHTDGKADPQRLMDETQEDDELSNIITGLMEEKEPYVYDEAVFRGAIRRINQAVLESEMESYREQLRLILNDDAAKLLMEKITNCDRELRRYKDEED